MTYLTPKPVANLLSSPERLCRGQMAGSLNGMATYDLLGAIKYCYLSEGSDRIRERVKATAVAILARPEWLVRIDASQGLPASEVLTRFVDSKETTWEEIRAVIEESGI